MKNFFILFFFCFVANAQNEIFYNDLKIGREMENNISIIANMGRSLNPQFRYNATENEWQYSDNGTTFTSLSDLVVDISTKADINSPVFTGTPEAPTVAQGDDSNKIATTKYVDTAIQSANIPDATDTVKGKIQLAGDLSGTASAPTVPRLSGIETILLGKVDGPANSLDNAIAVYDGVTGKKVKNSTAFVTTSGQVTAPSVNTTSLTTVNSIASIEVYGNEIKSKDGRPLIIQGGDDTEKVIIRGQTEQVGTLTYDVVTYPVGGDNITLDFLNSKYIRLNGVDLNSVSGIHLPSGIVGAREISFFNTTNKSVRFLNDAVTTGKKLDLNTMPWIDIEVGKKISFTYNANSDRWVLDNANDFFYSTIKNSSNFKSYGPIQITGTTTNPTKGTVSVDDFSCLADGEFWDCVGRYEQTSAGTAGSGGYLYHLPIGIEFDSSQPLASIKAATGAGPQPFNPDVASSTIGTVNIVNNITGGTIGETSVFAVSGNRFQFVAVAQGSSAGIHNSGYYQYSGVVLAFTFTIRFKGKGLRSTVDIASQAMSFQNMKNHASFRFYADGEVSPSTVENAEPTLPFITGPCTQPVVGSWNCPVTGLTVKPFCTTSRYGSAVGDDEVPFYDPVASTNTTLVFHARHSAAAKNTKFTADCQKLGQDAIEAYRSIALMAIKESNIYYDRDEFHTDERDTGKKWGGKAIYKKCVSTNTSDTKLVASGVDWIISLKGSFQWLAGPTVIAVPFYAGDTSRFTVEKTISNELRETAKGGGNGRPASYCVEYTKL